MSQKERKFKTKQLVYAATAIALAVVASMLKLFSLPLGGSVTLLSMLFVVLVGYWYGPGIGLTAGVAYGVLQFVIEPYFFTIPQLLTDYPLAFGALGLSGFFCNSKNGLTKGYVVSVLGRFFFSFLSGWIFFGTYASDYGMSAPVYSFVYNGSYLAAEAVLTLILLQLPPLKKALVYVKKMAISEGD